MRTSDSPRRGDADIGAIARLIGDPRRAEMLMALADGRAHPASELATAAGLSRSAATSHLNQLAHGGLIRVERVGRYRLHSLAGPEVANMVEALAALAPARPIASLSASTSAAALHEARTCYDHLAGRLGVALTDALRAHGAVIFDDPPVGSAAGGSPAAVRLGPAADGVFAALRIDVASNAPTPTRRPQLRLCLDWSERRFHLAGTLGGAIADTFLQHRWLIRRSGRALHLTDTGRRHLTTVLPSLTLDNQSGWTR